MRVIQVLVKVFDEFDRCRYNDKFNIIFTEYEPVPYNEDDENFLIRKKIVEIYDKEKFSYVSDNRFIWKRL